MINYAQSQEKFKNRSLSVIFATKQKACLLIFASKIIIIAAYYLVKVKLRKLFFRK